MIDSHHEWINSLGPATKPPRANRLSVIAPQVAVHLLDDSVVDEEMAAG